jgi:DNA topoisomerase-1
MMNLRDGKRGPWLGCQKFPKCRGRAAFAKLPEAEQKDLEQQLKKQLAGHERLHLTRRDGVTPVEEGTPLAALLLPGGTAELEKWEEVEAA